MTTRKNSHGNPERRREAALYRRQAELGVHCRELHMAETPELQAAIKRKISIAEREIEKLASHGPQR